MLIARVGWARAFVSIVWCFVTACIACKSADSLQSASHVNDFSLVRSAPIVISCTPYRATIGKYSGRCKPYLQESCTSITLKVAGPKFRSAMHDDYAIRSIVVALQAHKGMLLTTNLSSREDDGSFTYYVPVVIGVGISMWNQYVKIV